MTILDPIYTLLGAAIIVFSGRMALTSNDHTFPTAVFAALFGVMTLSQGMVFP